MNSSTHNNAVDMTGFAEQIRNACSQVPRFEIKQSHLLDRRLQTTDIQSALLALNKHINKDDTSFVAQLDCNHLANGAYVASQVETILRINEGRMNPMWNHLIQCPVCSGKFIVLINLLLLACHTKSPLTVYNNRLEKALRVLYLEIREANAQFIHA